jgi:hypothetical protein
MMTDGTMTFAETAIVVVTGVGILWKLLGIKSADEAHASTLERVKRKIEIAKQVQADKKAQHQRLYGELTAEELKRVDPDNRMGLDLCGQCGRVDRHPVCCLTAPKPIEVWLRKVGTDYAERQGRKFRDEDGNAIANTAATGRTSSVESNTTATPKDPSDYGVLPGSPLPFAGSTGPYSVSPW